MERLSIQPLPAGNAADETTLEMLTASEDFVKRPDGTFRFASDTLDEWCLVGNATKVQPTLQRLNLESGGVVYWFSAIHTGKAVFEFKHSLPAVPSREYLFASVL